MDLPDLEDVGRRPDRYYRDDAVRWVWILYGLAQATVTMLIAFDVLAGTTVPAVVTAVALIVYVAVNEILVRPYRTRWIERPSTRPPAAQLEAVPPAPPYDEDANPPPV